MPDLADLIRDRIQRAPKGFLAVAVDVEELERWAHLAEQPPADLPDEFVVHLPEHDAEVLEMVAELCE